MKKPLGLYIHIPFCAAKCPYCGFYSKAPAPGDSPEETAGKRREYVKRVIEDTKELGAKYGPGRIVDTVYIGGGTPSILESELIEDIIEAARESFEICSDAEISIEVNPGTVTGEKLKAYRKDGINRLSIGCQSLDDGVLKNLGRIHTAAQFKETFRLAREAGFENISCDLMFSVPGCTEGIWRETVREIVKTAPEHVSFYSLQIEEGTVFYDRYRRGEFDEVPDEVDRKMYHEALSILREAGYVQYEISSAAKEGFRCRHNIKYWTLAEYIGIGDSASSYIDGKRVTNPPFYEYHENTAADDMSEYVFTGLRMNDGIGLEDFEKRFGCSLFEAFPQGEEELATFVREGDVLAEGGRLKITEKGFDISNKIMAIFV
ncbi:MAG TPA: radical SAM family heme chaperone HemW [Candidatus Avanaerovorax faecigallinarum]|nr:radical SAM family heme chaperone HemW [Candidatus Avanaerovorax faecigallinarum]